jgi:hypothetical protein
MTTPDERTKAVVETRKFLRTLAAAYEINIPGLVQTVAVGLLRHYPLDVDLDVSASALPAFGLIQSRAKRDVGENRPTAPRTIRQHAAEIGLMSYLKDAPMEHPTPNQSPTAPTLFVDYDGTLHIGHALIGASGLVTLDSGRPLFEYAPLLVEMLKPYPAVQTVLTTTWLQTLPADKVIAYLPPELARRVVDTTRDRKARFSYMLNGSGRTDIITCLAIDDSVYGACHFGREPGELVQNFLLLESKRGISDEAAQQRIRAWLNELHKDCAS